MTGAVAAEGRGATTRWAGREPKLGECVSGCHGCNLGAARCVVCGGWLGSETRPFKGGMGGFH